ncbi:MAG: S8 family serine peptidase [Nocardioides sp.]
MTARRVRWWHLLLSGVLAAASATVVLAPAEAEPGGTRLHLVTLDGAGLAGYRGPLPPAAQRRVLLGTQDSVLRAVDAPEPTYRWTTAINGFAVELTGTQARELGADPRVQLVEPNAVRPLAGRLSGASRLSPTVRPSGGAGAVIGVVDSGIWPESPVFASGVGPEQKSDRFRGRCTAGEDWDDAACSRKLVGARWFVAGFGEQNLRSSSSLSARDDHGHGTQIASIAAGNAGVSVEVPGQRLGTYAGTAPQARLAVYKACWTAPDPEDDGCATADLVTAIDQASRDRVDVLNLSVGGPPGFDTVERALLGAAERDIVVVAAAGNDGDTAFAAHQSPWVISVGGTTGQVRRGTAELGRRAAVDGAMAASHGTGPAPLVLAEQARAAGATRTAAATCRPGALDAARTRGVVVLCERGGLARVAKSLAVQQADGVGMVLANTRPGTVHADLHAVPTLHLTRRDARALRRWHRDNPSHDITLRPSGVRRTPSRVTRWSAHGDPTAATVKPDLVAPGVGVLGAVPPSVRATRWDFTTGTSAAAASTSGLAAILVGRHDWSADRVRSALVTGAAAVRGHSTQLEEGAGRPSLARADRAGLAYLTARRSYRAWLDGDFDRDRLNVPSVLFTHHGERAVRTVTNVGRRTTAYSAVTTGFAEHDVVVRPASLQLRPGESGRFRVSVDGPTNAHPLDDGWLTWVGADGSRTRIPVVITR